MRVRCRCCRCRARRTLTRHPGDYLRLHHARCRIPGCSGMLRPDAYRMKKELKRRKICRELCWPFPHVRASAGCFYHPNSAIEFDVYHRRQVSICR